MCADSSKVQFDYNEAFARNLGWVTPEEQQNLRGKRIATAGLGGVGGNHLITLTRMGIGAFTIADFDHFDLANFNRQAGANMNTIGRQKLDVMVEKATSINPDLKLNTFADGVNEENLNDFLQGVDLYVDSLDFFALDIRRKVFHACSESQIPAITVAPVGLGCTALCFMPGSMTFEEYFQLEGHTEDEQYLRFLIGLTPGRLHADYLVYPSAVDIHHHRVPSTAAAIQMCSGLAASLAFKILLGRGRVISAPMSQQYDAYHGKTKTVWRPWGNRNPIQQMALFFARRKLLH